MYPSPYFNNYVSILSIFFYWSILKTSLKHVVSPLNMSLCISYWKGLFFKPNNRVPCHHLIQWTSLCFLLVSISPYSSCPNCLKGICLQSFGLTQGQTRSTRIVSPLFCIIISPLIFIFIFIFVWFSCNSLVGETRYYRTEVSKL